MNNQANVDEELLQHRVFRTLLQAMSHPGTVCSLREDERAEPLLAVLESLLDQEVSFHLAEADPDLADSVRRCCGARPALSVAETDFLLAAGGSSRGQLESLRRGTPDYPDRGATVIYQVASFAPGGCSPVLAGPGIKEIASPSIHGLDPAELPSLRRINSDYPLGIEAILVSRSGEVLCLPRSTRIGE